MKILIAEDEPDIAMPYRIVLEKRNHQVMITDNGEACLEAYQDALRRTPKGDGMPFDAVVLDYRMPKKNGLEVAKEILAVNPHQRIIFASAYVRDVLMEAVRQLRQFVELVQKPFNERQFIEILEDAEVYQELRKLDVDINQIKLGQFRHEQLRKLLEILK